MAAVALNGFSLIARWISAGHPPLTGTYETLSLFSFFIGIVFIFIVRKRWGKWEECWGVSVLPLIMVFVLVALINYSEAGVLAVSLRSIWLFIHVPIAIFSYALFGVAAVCGALYLLKSRKQGNEAEGERSHDLSVIDNVVYRSVAGGFILLTIAIVTGAVWAEERLGELLELGSERDMEPDYMVCIRHIPAHQAGEGMEGKEGGGNSNNRICSGDIHLFRSESDRRDCIHTRKGERKYADRRGIVTGFTAERDDVNDRDIRWGAHRA